MFGLCAGQNDKLYRGTCYHQSVDRSFENNIEIDMPRTGSVVSIDGVKENTRDRNRLEEGYCAPFRSIAMGGK